mgnify:CR=1
MLKFLNKKKNDNKGFSLVELIIVVAILAILVGLLAPQYIKYVEKSRKSADASNLSEMVNAVQIYAADAEVGLPEGEYTITINGENTVIAGVEDEVKIGTETKKAYEWVAAAVAETAPDYASTKMKSSKWDGDLVATIKVDANGGTKVSYSPAKLQEFINNKTTK